ncbi:MAG: hypothetical protein ACOX6V_04210 [Patescibacteria group bacterium]|jgi:hypothetical protein
MDTQNQSPQNPFEAPPISGENVPYRELTPEMPSVPAVDPNAPKLKKGVNKILVIAFSIFGLFLLSLGGLLFINKKVEPTPTTQTTVSPVPVATQSAVKTAVPVELSERISNLEKKINTVDLQELDLAYPKVEWDIRF